MAATLAAVADGYDIYGSTPTNIYDVTFDSSYPAGGYAITAAQVGLQSIVGVDVLSVNTAATVQEYVWNSTTGKLMVLMVGASTAAFADLTPTTNIATLVIRVRFIGPR